MPQFFVRSNGRLLLPFAPYDGEELATLPQDRVYKISPSIPTRTDRQNRAMWALLRDVARCHPEGRVWPKETWKAAVMSLYGIEVHWQPGLEGSPPFPAGFRSSQMSKEAMGDLLTFIRAYGDRHGVVFREPEDIPA